MSAEEGVSKKRELAKDEDDVEVVLVIQEEEEEEENYEEWEVVNVILSRCGEPAKRRCISERELIDTACAFASWKKW